MSNTIANPLRSLAIAGAAIFAITMAAPTTAAAYDTNISFDGFSFNDDEDLLEQLIALDADDIEELREDMAEARADIRDAIADIEEAREEVRSAPGGAVIMKVALTTASAVVTKATGRAFRKVNHELDRAQRELADTRESVGEAEFTETTLAISVIREEIEAIKSTLSELTTAMKA
jgi:chromosome segregation ATPase